MNISGLAEAINARWPREEAIVGSVTYGGSTSQIISLDVKFNGFFPITLDVNGDDYINAQWIIWCLDKLEELHQSQVPGSVEFGIDLVGKVGSNPVYFVQEIVYPDHDAWAPGDTFPFYDTRWQAVTVALFGALGVAVTP